MAKWKPVLQHDAWELLDLLEEALALTASPKEWNPRVRALLDRLRVKECDCTSGNDGLCVQVDANGKCVSCGAQHVTVVADMVRGVKLNCSKQTTREKVDDRLNGPGGGYADVVRILADAIDELRER